MDDQNLFTEFCASAFLRDHRNVGGFTVKLGSRFKVQGCMFIVNSSQLANKTAEDATESKYTNGTHYYWNRSMLMPSPVPYRLAGTPLGSTIFSNDHPDTISSILRAYSSSFHCAYSVSTRFFTVL